VERDMMGAKRLGMITVIRGKLCKYADYSINDLRELLPIVEKIAMRLKVD
jgi:FMN phosphatase YigB (HAD superfamily)